MEIYAGMVANLDYNVGRLVDYLETIGEFDNTLIFFMSDNGAESDREDRNPNWVRGVEREGFDNRYEHLGTAESWALYGPGWAQASMAGYRLFKGFTTEGGTRVPAFLYHSSMSGNKTIDDQYLTLMDVMPTFLDVAKADFDPGEVRGRKVSPMNGRSFAPIVRGERVKVHPADEIIATELRDLSISEPERLQQLVVHWHEFARENHVMESVTPQWPQPRSR